MSYFTGVRLRRRNHSAASGMPSVYSASVPSAKKKRKNCVPPGCQHTISRLPFMYVAPVGSGGSVGEQFMMSSVVRVR